MPFYVWQSKNYFYWFWKTNEGLFINTNYFTFKQMKCKENILLVNFRFTNLKN